MTMPGRFPFARLLLTFLVTTVPFALSMSLMMVLSGEPTATSIAIGGASGLFFGVVMTAILGTMHVSGVRRILANPRREHFDVRQQCTIEVDLPVADTLELARRAVERLPRVHMDSVDSGAGKIHAQAGMTWKSWGESIDVSIVPGSAGGSVVTVESRPAMSSTILDYGRNLENVETIARSIEDLRNGERSDELLSDQ
jgi:hypothetical protein